MLQNQLPFMLRSELERQCPDTWDAIYHTLARRLADNLLQELDGLPSPEGRLFSEIRDEAVQASTRMKGA